MAYINDFDNMNNHFDDILRIRENAENALHRTENFINGPEFDAADHNLLKIRLELLEENFKKFVYYNDLLTLNVEYVTRDLGKEKVMEESYIQMKMKMKNRLDILCAPDNRDNTNKDDDHAKKENESILLDISLPSFSGEPSQFKPFVEAFVANVGNSEEYTMKQKMDYLKSRLTYSAADIFDENPTENYAEMLEILKRRYHVITFRDAGKPRTVYVTVQALSEELFNSIMEGSYSHAVHISKILNDTYNVGVIVDIAKKLAKENGAKLMNYIYQLWIGNNKIVKFISPVLPWIFDQKYVMIKEKNGFPLTLSESTDGDADRHAFGDSNDRTSKKVNWKIIPIWQNNRVHFNIKNAEYDLYLKLQLKREENGDRKAYAGTSGDNMRNYWFMEPVLGGENQFLIINRQFNQGLKLEVGDSNKNWPAYGHNGSDVHNDTERFAWNIIPVEQQ